MRVWRISKKRYAAAAFSGEGGLKASARWHHVGNRIVYTAESLSLAALETWVHVEPGYPLADHVEVWADIPDDLFIHNVGEASLPEGWRTTITPLIELRDMGT
jgi:RES domain-containing protein